MPMFREPSSPRASFSPLKSNIDDMVIVCEELENQLKFFVEDGEIYGLLTEDTFLDNAPQVLKCLERISAIAMNSTRDLTFQDEIFDSDTGSLAIALYSFLSEHKRAIDVLTAQQKLIKTTGPYYDSVGQSLRSQRNALNNFKSALEAQYSEVKARSVEQWTVFNTSMSAANEAYPPPEIMVE